MLVPDRRILILVVPAKAGISPFASGRIGEIPAFAGMTKAGYLWHAFAARV